MVTNISKSDFRAKSHTPEVNSSTSSNKKSQCMALYDRLKISGHNLVLLKKDCILWNYSW